MKKGLLLSVVASTMIFAGGDIAPVEPAAPAPAADCSDFYGSVGVYYQTQATTPNGAGELFDGVLAANNFSATAVIGVEKEIAYGIGFGAEAAGWTAFGLNTAELNNAGARVSSGLNDDGTLSQLYITANFGNTAVKVGRFALPASLSPWAWSDRTAGVLDATFEGAVVANTDVADTTLYAVYAKRMHLNDGLESHEIGADKVGLFAAGFVNKSLANTSITGVGYYVPDAALVAGNTEAAYAGFLTVDYTMGDYKLGLQGAYVGGDVTVLPDATMGVAAKVSTTYGAFDASIAASYINDGDYALNLVTGYGALYTDNEISSEVYTGAGGIQYATTAVLAKVGYSLGMYGKVYGSVGYWDFDTTVAADADTAIGARAGYKFTVAGINTKVEYRYRSITNVAGVDAERHRVRVEATYKF